MTRAVRRAFWVWGGAVRSAMLAPIAFAAGCNKE